MANNTRQLGWASFASVMVVVMGALQTVVGLTALLNEGFLNSVGNGHLVVWDLAAWGWIHLVFGLVTLMVGTSLFSGAAWARTVAVMLATLNLVAQFVFLGVYPLWSLVLMGVSLLAVFAMTARADQ